MKFFYFIDPTDTGNRGALLCIPYLLGTTPSANRKTKTWKPSKLEARDSFITHVSSAAQVEEVVERRKAKLLSFGMTLQPFIIIVGSTLKDVTANYVAVNGSLYITSTTTHAVDACFKIIFSLNLKYPFECTTTWHFIQNGLYGLKTPYDKNFTTVSSLLSNLELDPL